MRVFSITADDQIRVMNAVDARTRSTGQQFRTEEEWSRIAAELPMARLVALWNALAGVTPVKRFTSRAKSAKRIWQAIGNLAPAPERTAPPTGGPNSQAQTAGAGRESKQSRIVAMLQTKGGISIDQLVHATGWRKHSVRGFLSGTMRKKLGLKIVSVQREDGVRVYRMGA